MRSVFKTKTPTLPALDSVDGIITELDKQLDQAQELVRLLRDRAREAESDVASDPR